MDRLWNVRQPHIDIVPTFWCSFNVLAIIFALNAVVGYLIFFQAMKINEFTIRYDDVCSQQRGTQRDCIVRFTPTVTLENPMVYYRLDSFYNNYRSFVKSKDIFQLAGKEKTI